MKIRLDWTLFLLTAASYVFYPVWRLPLPWPAQWALLNAFVLLAASTLYSPLKGTSLNVSLPELGELWPAVLAAALICLPFWLLPLPTGTDAQSHAGPPAWLLARIAHAAGFSVGLLPLISLPLALLTAILLSRTRQRLRLPGNTAALASLLAAGNLYFALDRAFSLAGAIGPFKTVLRYPPLAKFLFFPAYALLGITEAGPKLVEFLFILLTAVYMMRLLSFFGSRPDKRLTYLFIAFFPTFFNLSITAELEAGTVFFFTAAVYHFIKAADSGDREQFLISAFWCAVGFFYKQLVLGLVLSFVPPLLVLIRTRPEKRGNYLFGLKTLAIPLLTGLPFIVLSDLFRIRDTSLMPANLFSLSLMTMDLRNIYMTCGSLLTGLLAVSAVYTLWRRRSAGLWLILYVGAAYYFMISLTGAVGYIRHAQPFYIPLVFMAALALSDLAAAVPRNFGKAASYAVLAILIYQSVLAKAPYQRTTAFNYYAATFPYWKVARYLKPGDSVYAPMEVEPSHFYLAKYGLAGKVKWDRTLPPDFTAEKATAEFKKGGYDYLLLPSTPFKGVKPDMPAITAALLTRGDFAAKKIFDYHGNELTLMEYVRHTGQD